MPSCCIFCFAQGVEFEDWRSMSIEHDRRLQQGYYFADPSDYEQPADEEPAEDPYGDSE